MTTEEKLRKYNTDKDKSLRNEIVSDNLNLCELIAKKYSGKGVDYDDIYQVACIGLINAIERFDANKGYKFVTFATPTIMGEIKKYFRDKGFLIKIPRKIYEVFQMANRIRLSRMEYDGYIPTLDEIAGVMKMSKKELNNCMVFESVVNLVLLDQPVYDEDSLPVGQLIGVEDENFLVIENRDFIKSAMKILTYEEKRFVISRYYRNMTQKDIAAKNGVSQMYVSRLERKVLEKLKKLYFE